MFIYYIFTNISKSLVKYVVDHVLQQKQYGRLDNTIKQFLYFPDNSVFL